jgi:Ca2+-binding RTX toxin-like protein
MKVEVLEHRRLRSVSVNQGYPGYYEVSGDDGPDVISISVSGADSTFTLDGVTYGGVAYVSVFGNGGDDVIAVAVGDGPVGTSIHAGPGNDDVTLTGGGAVWGDGGDDILRINNSRRGELYGGSGDDRMYISGACPDAEIHGDQGNDTVDASASSLGVYVFGDQGGDTLLGSQYDDQFDGGQGSDLMFGSAGNDIFYAADWEHDRIIGGSGIDVALIDYGDGVWGVEYVLYY